MLTDLEIRKMIVSGEPKAAIIRRILESIPNGTLDDVEARLRQVLASSLFAESRTEEIT